MINWVELIEKVRKSIVSVSVIYDGKLESYGTGAIINRTGTVLTAGHVVDLVKEFDLGEIKKTQILVNGEGIERSSYRPLLASLSLKMDNPSTEIVLDVALLVPLAPIRMVLIPAKLEVEPYKIKVGDQVVMAGYSEETPFPLDFDRTVRNKIPSELENNYDTFLGTIKPPTWKSGMVAHVAVFGVGGLFAGQVIHVDNGMHKGASGGPIFNSYGKVIAYITDRAMVSAKVLVEEKIHEFHVPSGNTFGFSISAIKGICDQMGCSKEIEPGT